MRKLFDELEGDREKILAAYVAADQRGEVLRKNDINRTSSSEYAIRLWANGVHKGWLEVSSSVEKPKIAKSKYRNDEVDLFEKPLTEMGILWRDDPSRPEPSTEAKAFWSGLVAGWCAHDEMPLLVRKGGPRGVIEKLPSGRPFVRCDNSPAHWAFMGCYADQRPSLTEVFRQLAEGELPILMARARTEKALIEAGSHTAYGGFTSKSKYGQVNKFTDGKSYKLCHIRPVGLGGRGEVEEFDEISLKDHMMRLLDPTNMIVVPLRYSGVGECQAFLDAFLPSSDQATP